MENGDRSSTREGMIDICFASSCQQPLLKPFYFLIQFYLFIDVQYKMHRIQGMAQKIL